MRRKAVAAHPDTGRLPSQPASPPPPLRNVRWQGRPGAPAQLPSSASSAQKPAPASDRQTQSATCARACDRIRQLISRDPDDQARGLPASLLRRDRRQMADVRGLCRQVRPANGPTPRGGVTHQDFLNHVTPREIYGSGGIKATELHPVRDRELARPVADQRRRSKVSATRGTNANCARFASGSNASSRR